MFGDHLSGIYEKAFDPAISWEERLLRARELGFDYVEISIDEKDERIARLYDSGAALSELRAACANTGMQIKSMCLSAHRRFPFGSADAAVNSLLNGTLLYNPDTVCAHHHHEGGHDCGSHSCGEDKHGCAGNH